MTHLHISNVDARTQDLINLCKIKNLVALSLSRPRSRDSGPDLNDRIVRAWHECVTEGEAFQNLRVLVLRFHALSEVSFDRLQALPNLRLLALDQSWDASSNRTVVGDGWSPGLK